MAKSNVCYGRLMRQLLLLTSLLVCAPLLARASVCARSKLIHIVPVQRPVSRHDLIPKRNLSSFILFKTNGHEFKKLDSSYVQKEASYSLLKFDESACISVFEMSDNWEDTVKEIFDHVSGI